MAVKKKKKKPKLTRFLRTLDTEEPLPRKWWEEAPPLADDVREELLCDTSRFIKGYLGTPHAQVQRTHFAEDIYRLLAENERLSRENKRLRKKLRKAST